LGSATLRKRDTGKRDMGTGFALRRAGELERWRAGELESWRAGELKFLHCG